MGFGEWEEQIKEYEQTYPNIHFQEAVSPSEVSRYTRSADAGICLQENIGLNYFLSLPNKLFEYIINGLPVIVSDFPEMRRVVDEAGCGWKVAVDRDALLALVNSISLEDIAMKRARALQYRKTIGWQNEEKILLQVYRPLDAKYKKTARKKAQA
jgi:glycosyltransferase involved in cell wall biosynthesis